MEINKARPWKHGFQSTHPVRGATRYSRMLGGSASFQSTHPVRGATSEWIREIKAIEAFQSTHPVRGATEQALAFLPAQAISIHAPRAGCD